MSSLLNVRYGVAPIVANLFNCGENTILMILILKAKHLAQTDLSENRSSSLKGQKTPFANEAQPKSNDTAKVFILAFPHLLDSHQKGPKVDLNFAA